MKLTDLQKIVAARLIDGWLDVATDYIQLEDQLFIKNMYSHIDLIMDALRAAQSLHTTCDENSLTGKHFDNCARCKFLDALDRLENK